MSMAEGAVFWSLTNANARIRSAIAEATADTAKMNSATTARHVRDLAAELDRLEMILEAQWSLLREHLPLTDDQLRQRVRELDLSDGRLDGKIHKDPTVACSACGRQVRRSVQRCTYCGDTMDARTF